MFVCLWTIIFYGIHLLFIQWDKSLHMPTGHGHFHVICGTFMSSADMNVPPEMFSCLKSGPVAELTLFDR